MRTLCVCGTGESSVNVCVSAQTVEKTEIKKENPSRNAGWPRVSSRQLIDGRSSIIVSSKCNIIHKDPRGCFFFVVHQRLAHNLKSNQGLSSRIKKSE